MPQIHNFSANHYLFTTTKNSVAVVNSWFEPDYWQQQNAITGQSFGRNITYFFAYKNKKYVLRHYFRGGLIGKIAKDGYFYFGLKRSRVYREFELLEQMQQLNLPVPTPIAARLIRDKHLYSADIIMEKIEHSSDVFHLLKTSQLSEDIWQKIGETIAKFHHAGVFHADLNIHNIMLDKQNKVWLIDFDRGCFKKPNQNWQKSNLNRLLISLNKEKNKQSCFHWQPTDWKALLVGYLAFTPDPK